MKKKLFVGTLSVILALSITACGGATQQPEPQPVEETPTIAEVAAEMEVAEATETEEEVIPEETETEVLVEETETEVAETETEVDPMEALLESNMGSYISDGVFDAERFANDTGVTRSGVSDHSFIIIYGDWFVQSGNSSEKPATSFVAIGTWDPSNTERSNQCTYSYIFPKRDDIGVSGKITIPTECIVHLQDIVSYVKENGPNVAPDVPGTEFYPCDPADETIQTK